MVTKVTYFRGGKWNKGGCAWLPFHYNCLKKKIDRYLEIYIYEPRHQSYLFLQKGSNTLF